MQFLEWFVEKRENMDGVFSTVSTMGMTDGGAAPGASFRTNYGIERTLWGKVPNVVVYLDTRPSLLKEEGRTREGLLRIIEDAVTFLREHLPEEDATNRRGRIYLRLADVFDAWDEDPGFFVRMLKLFAALPVSGIMFEDVRGTHFPFQTAELVRLMRRYKPVAARHPPPPAFRQRHRGCRGDRGHSGRRRRRLVGVHAPCGPGLSRLVDDAAHQPAAGRQRACARDLQVRALVGDRRPDGEDSYGRKHHAGLSDHRRAGLPLSRSGFRADAGAPMRPAAGMDRADSGLSRHAGLGTALGYRQAPGRVGLYARGSSRTAISCAPCV